MLPFFEYVPGHYLVMAGLALAALFAFFIFLIYSKAQRGKRNSLGIGLGLTSSDIAELQKKGLLSSEERAKVAAAMARSFKGELDASDKRRNLRPSDLLVDPEVRRLEELAEAKQRERELSASEGNSLPSDAEVANPDVLSGVVDDEVPSLQINESKQPEPLPSESPYPPEVQRLLDAGLISVAEAEQIRERAMNRPK